MITNISPREAELIRQIDEQGGQLAAWRDRAIAAEAELARLRKDVEFYRNFAAEVLAVKRLPMPHDMEALCRTAYENRYHKIKAEVGYDEWRLIWVRAIASHEVAPPAQPAEPVQRLSDERAAFEAWHNEYRTQELVRRDDTYYNTHVRCRWEGWQARAIESALQPGWRDDLVNGLMGSTISETCRADAAEAAIESIVELLDQHTDDLHVNHGCRPTESVSKARDIAIAALPPAPKATK